MKFSLRKKYSAPDIIPNGTVVRVRLHILRGEAGPGGWLTASEQTGGLYLHTKLIIVEGPYKDRCLYEKFAVPFDKLSAQEVRLKKGRLNVLIAETFGLDPTQVLACDDLKKLEGLQFTVNVGTRTLKRSRYPVVNCVTRISAHPHNSLTLGQRLRERLPWFSWPFSKGAIPEGTVVKACLKILPGGMGPNGLLERIDGVLNLHLRFQVVEGAYEGRSFEGTFPVLGSYRPDNVLFLSTQKSARKLALVLSEALSKPFARIQLFERIADFEGIEAFVQVGSPALEGPRFITKEDSEHPLTIKE